MRLTRSGRKFSIGTRPGVCVYCAKKPISKTVARQRRTFIGWPLCRAVARRNATWLSVVPTPNAPFAQLQYALVLQVKVLISWEPMPHCHCHRSARQTVRFEAHRFVAGFPLCVSAIPEVKTNPSLSQLIALIEQMSMMFILRRGASPYPNQFGVKIYARFYR